jgi:hypothetical protein
VETARAPHARASFKIYLRSTTPDCTKLGFYDVPAVKMRQDELNGGNFNKVFFGGLAAN